MVRVVVIHAGGGDERCRHEQVAAGDPGPDEWPVGICWACLAYVVDNIPEFAAAEVAERLRAL